MMTVLKKVMCILGTILGTFIGVGGLFIARTPLLILVPLSGILLQSVSIVGLLKLFNLEVN